MFQTTWRKGQILEESLCPVMFLAPGPYVVGAQ